LSGVSRPGPAAYRGGFRTPTAVTRLEITLRLFQVDCQRASYRKTRLCRQEEKTASEAAAVDARSLPIRPGTDPLAAIWITSGSLTIRERSRAVDYGFRPTRRIISANLLSSRSGSKIGSTLRLTRQGSRSPNASSRACSARSLSFSPTQMIERNQRGT
jgi:hypothetical protein